MALKPDQDSGMGGTDEVRRSWFGGRKRAAASEAVSAEIAPPPPKKKRKEGLAGLFSGLMTVTLIVTIVIGSMFSVGRKDFDAPGPLQADKSVIIEKGASTEEIVDLLEREGVVAHPRWFWAALLFRDIQSKFTSDEALKKRAKAGEYLFKRQVTMAEVIDIITSGRSVEHVITIPEGLTSEQIVERLKENDLLTGEVASIPAEGSLLPDTYKINRGTPRDALLARMAREQRKLLDDVWKRRAKDLTLKSPRELVILASIVEKETGRADERSRVAGVFYNRMSKNMKLQSDPTIIYGLVGGKASLGRGILRSEIERPTPYNTYVINGLPPGPIANPGRAAMEATANPSKTRDLYFVADGTGGHAFAETLEQHNRNVARWRQIEATRGASAPAAPEGAQPAPAPAPEATPPSPSSPASGFASPPPSPANPARRPATTPAPRSTTTP
ncbi:MAG: endolytic transglycosylase MltG [Proteobacteria bacterium]|nr:endolytic transglycosylase MltG [Pseudomonadota bacterium]